ncbi:hypothetical protein ACT8ZV_10005 [Nocardioides sp. MAHUQ-72]|uniref:HNH endonuclease signature motif containing protein n=1 Tax=unclassified Nocardioides TaxID=2615069 RepID=UPI00361140A7
MFETGANWDPVEVDDLDADGVLELLEVRRQGARAEERGKLRLALQWAVLHPATADTGVATWGGPSVLLTDESLGGDGAPAVAAFAPEPVAATLGISTAAGMALIADALDLQFRLPRIWRLVEQLAVEPYRARQVAQATHRLSKTGAAYVDEQLAPRLSSCGWKAVETTVAHAIATFDPDLIAQKEKKGRNGWHVTLRHDHPGQFDGTSYLDVAGDTFDLTAFHDLVCDQAAQLKALGDTDELEVRKAKALGVIAAQQATLDLLSLTGQDTGQGTGQDTDRAGASVAARPRPPKTRLYLHLNLADLATACTSTSDGVTGGTVTGRVERLGPATIDLIKVWVGRSRVTVQPVLDMNSRNAVDQHDPPPWMAELVILRDGHCVFPWCAVDARRSDLDHIEPYVPIDDGGPPGQTAPDRLAPLCRRHHRCKTSGRWRYRRRPDGSYEWHGPHGRSYLVTPHGTIRLDTN